jgi:tripartite-type tricarboxylate transporter receptor subunit TctC
MSFNFISKAMASCALALLLGLGANGVTPTAAAAEDFYEDQTIRMLIGRGPGSGADTAARLFAQHWAKYILGEPRIIPQNVGGSAVHNTLYETAKPDGLTITFTPCEPASQLSNAPGFRADYDKMLFVGALYNPAILYVSTEQMADAGDLASMDHRPPHRLGHPGPHCRHDAALTQKRSAKPEEHGRTIQGR